MFIDIYRKSFEDAGVGGYWDNSTLYLYYAIIIIVTLFGIYADRNKKRAAYFWTVISSIILIIVLGLRARNVGIDTEVYQDSFSNALKSDTFSDSTTEPGYHFLLKILRLLISSPELAIFVCSFATVYFVMSSLYKYKDQISLCVAFAFYVGIFYFQAMNLLRIYLAASFVLWNYHYLIDKEYLKFVLIILVTSLLHYSTLVMLLPLGYLMLHQRRPTLAFLLVVGLTLALIPLSVQFADYISIARYAAYGDTNDSSQSIGIMLFFDYLPFFFLLYYVWRYHINNQWSDLLVSLSVVGFLIRLISYYITIAGRLGVHFMGLYLLVLPFFVYHIKNNHKKLYLPVMLGLFVYLAVRIHFYFIGYLAGDGIMPYNFFWNS